MCLPVGVLQHTIMVVHHGQVLLRRMIELLKQTQEYHHFVILLCLNWDFKSDL